MKIDILETMQYIALRRRAVGNLLDSIAWLAQTLISGLYVYILINKQNSIQLYQR